MIYKETGLWVICLWLCLSHRCWAVDELSLALAVNPQSVESLTIANHYASLRQIPSRCIVALPDVPAGLSCSYEPFKTRILEPLLTSIHARGLSQQTDVIAYSAGFPTAIDLTVPMQAKTDLHQVFTKMGATNGLTMLYQLLDDKQLAFLSPRCNFYARPDLANLQLNPFFDDDRQAFESVAAAQSPQEVKAAITTLRALLKKHPQQWPLRYRLAKLQVAAGQSVEAFQTIAAMQQDRVAYRKLFEQDKAFASVKDNRLYLKQLENMPNILPNRIPPLAFSSSIAWGQNGLPLGTGTLPSRQKQPGPSYRLSAMLAVTAGRGTTLAEAITILQRAAQADRKGEKATFYFSDSADVRSTTRSPLFKEAADLLKALGHQTIIDIDRLPQKQSKLMGAMLGSANYDWPAAGNQLLPGSIAENLTSTSGVLHQGNDQTPMVELLRAGAAGTSGTVTEPYALQFKFPTPHLFAYYAAGLSLIEAFYLSVESPYQLLIVGDPLCRPYGSELAQKLEITSIDSEDRSLALQLKYPNGLPAATKQILQLKVYLDGLFVFSVKPFETLKVNELKLAPGWHTLDVVTIHDHPLRYPTRHSRTFVVGDPSRLPKLTVVSQDQAQLSAQIDCKLAKQFAIEHLGRNIWEANADQDTAQLKISQTGYGPVKLRPLALIDDVWVAGEPIVHQVPMP